MKAIKQTLLAIALAGAFTSANATPVDWTLNNVTFNGWGAGTLYLTGSFTYDVDINQYSSVSLSFSVPNLSYTTGASIDSGNANSFTFRISTGASGVINFTSALANNGGNISLASSSDWNGGKPLSSGSVTGVPQATASAVPEPEVYALMLAGLGLVGFAARRKLS